MENFQAVILYQQPQMQSQEATVLNWVILLLRIFECNILFVTPVTCPQMLCSDFAVKFRQNVYFPKNITAHFFDTDIIWKPNV